MHTRCLCKAVNSAAVLVEWWTYRDWVASFGAMDGLVKARNRVAFDRHPLDGGWKTGDKIRQHVLRQESVRTLLPWAKRLVTLRCKPK